MPHNFHNKCLVCDTEKIIPLKGYEKYYLVKCENCGFVFTKLIPTQEELDENYGSYERDDYLSPVTVKRYNEILEKFEKYRKTNRILDVGCGMGYFLEIAKDRGWEVYGTEYTDEAIEICKSKEIEVRKGKLTADLFDKESFDVITSFEVIEHINDPVDEIRISRELLRNGGIYYLTTPNFNSLLRYYLKGKYTYVLIIPDHLCYYTPKSLKYVLTKCGFKKKWIRTTGFSISNLKQKNITSASEIINPDSSDEKIRVSMERNVFMKIMKRSANSLLTLLGVGDTIKATFIKP